jgi:hypothetical protein
MSDKSKFEISNIPDDKADVRFAQHLVGLNAKPSGRMRVVVETGRIEIEWVGAMGAIFLPIPGVSKKTAENLGPHDQVGRVRLDG